MEVIKDLTNWDSVRFRYSRVVEKSLSLNSG